MSRGCLLILVPLLGLLALGGVLSAMALSAPDLGAPPGGRDDGGSETAIAARVAADLAAQLALQSHAVVSLSERDLTVLVRENNPNPRRVLDPQARVRDGLVVIDARTPFGPFTVDAVLRVALVLGQGADGLPKVAADFRAVQLGGLGLPDFAAKALQDRIQQTFDLQDLLSSNEALRLARRSLDCVGVGGDVVRLGFHRLGVSQAPGDCG